jgi:serine/threonine protein kinase
MLRTLDQLYRVALATLVRRNPEDPAVGDLTMALQRNLETHVRTGEPFRAGFVCLLGTVPSPSKPETPITLKLRLGSENVPSWGKVYVTASHGVRGAYKRYSEAYEILFRNFNGFLSMPKGSKDNPEKWNPNSLREWQAIMKFCPKPGMAHCRDLFIYQSPKQPGQTRVGMVFDRFDGDLQMIYPIQREQDLRTVLRNSARSLFLLHQSGVVHRDVKPENFGVNLKTLTVRILDPGFACFLRDPLKPCGSPIYLAPEVLSYAILLAKSPQTPPPPSLPAQDVWSFAVMMYALATGDAPSFQGVLIENLKKKTEIDLSNLSILIDEEISKRFDLSSQMKTVLRGMLQITPSERLSMKTTLDLMNRPDFSIREEPLQPPSSREIAEK